MKTPMTLLLTTTLLTSTTLANTTFNMGFAKSAIQSQLSGDNENKNLTFSPASAKLAYTMLLPGTDDAAILAPFGSSDSEDVLRDANSLMLNLGVDQFTYPLTNAAQYAANPADPYVLRAANAIFVRNSLRLNSDYEQQASSVGNAIVAPFGPSVVSNVNRLVSTYTNNKINDLLPPQMASADLILLNAIYFKANWATKFDKRKTVADDFQLANRNFLKVDYMCFGSSKKCGACQESEDLGTCTERLKIDPLQAHLFHGATFPAGYALYNFNNRSGHQGEILRLPFAQGPSPAEKASVFFVLPQQGNAISDVMAETVMNEDFWSRIDSATIISSDVKRVYGELTLVKVPKFRIESNLDLLQGIWGGNPQTRQVNLPAINLPDILQGVSSLAMGSAIQKAFFEVTEDGAEATAATATANPRGLVLNTPPPPPPVQFIADRPFAAVIRHDVTKEILFVAIVNAPTLASTTNSQPSNQ